MLISRRVISPVLERLCDRLKQVGADQYSAPLDKQLVPLEITQGVYLNQVAFRNRLAALRKLSGGNLRFQTQPTLVLSPDPEYRALREKLLKTLEASRNDRPL